MLGHKSFVVLRTANGGLINSMDLACILKLLLILLTARLGEHCIVFHELYNTAIISKHIYLSSGGLMDRNQLVFMILLFFEEAKQAR